jgi:hypothetical protein
MTWITKNYWESRIDSQMAVRLSSLRTGRALLPRFFFFFASDTYFCWRLSKPKGLVLLEGLGKLEKK